jgi:hypothetical protein
MNYELKHIRGIPYYLDGTTIKTFEVDGGKAASTCIAIGTFKDDSIIYYDDWRERVASRLELFRTSLVSQERDKLRQSITKPQKPRKTPRATGKTVRTKSVKNT